MPYRRTLRPDEGVNNRDMATIEAATCATSTLFAPTLNNDWASLSASFTTAINDARMISRAIQSQGRLVL